MLELDGMNEDSLTDMLKVSFSWENWTAILEISDKLFELAVLTYGSRQQGAKKPYLKKNIAYYLGYSLCMKGIAYQKLGNLAESRKCIGLYSDMSWVKNLDHEAYAEVEYYKNIAIANTFVIDLLEGKVEVLADYVEFIRTGDKEELLACLITVLESAIKYNFSIDWVLDEFHDQLKELSCREKQEDIRYYIDYMHLSAIYLYKREKIHDAINLTLYILVISSKLYDGTGFRKIVSFYEHIRSHASAEQQESYQNIMKNILEREFLKDEKGDLVINSRIVD
ncbi:DNA-binding protein [Paenibacillus tritici]|uniref:DNA-binding protein n=1 Tax=Paenibacillus tritici TaxID=1873425 RepID=A0ABX2DU94_9BACL|nr:DNA-binding protein [Paenibacillus tritici]NQX47583.1 DNA-binding protein [Paenibacillus tritici]